MGDYSDIRRGQILRDAVIAVCERAREQERTWDECFICGGTGIDPDYLSFSCEACNGAGMLPPNWNGETIEP